MDSITQAALGAAIGEGMLGRRDGRKAAAWGALCATLPDLDTFYPYAGPVSSFTWHRGYSHSLLVLALAAPLLAWLILRVHRRTLNNAGDARRWGVMVLLVLLTHTLLDCITVYGTQVLLPFSDYPVAASAIFIIDPLYTLPLAAGVLCALWMRRTRRVGRLVNAGGLALSTAYLCWCLAVKTHVNEVAERALANEGLAHAQYLSMPMPFNALLWRVIVMEDGNYREGFYSVFDEDDAIVFQRHANEQHLLRGLDTEGSEIARLKWFSRGFYKVWRDGQTVVFSDLRIGALDIFFFNFAVAKTGDGVITPLPAAWVPLPEVPEGLFSWLIRRIGSRDAGLPGAARR